MFVLNEEQCLVLIVDVQDKLINAVFNKEQVEKNSSIIGKVAATLNLPVVVTEQYPKGLGGTVATVAEVLPKDAKFFEKTAFDASADEELIAELKNTGRKQVVIFGIETHICVHQTASNLVEKGYEVYLVKDSCGSRSLEQHLAGLDRMRENGVNITTTEIAMFELLKTAKHPHFKELQALIK